MNFAKLLRGSEYAVNKDQVTFRKWADGEINTTMAITQFKKNNGIKGDIEIDKTEFEQYLYGLSWGRD